MSFTQVTVTRTYRTPSGGLASGAIVFTPTRPMWNGGTVVERPERKDLAAGVLSVSLAANTDPATVPVGGGYKVEEYLDGVASVRTYYVVVPHDQGATVPLESLDFLLDEAGSVTVPVAGPPGPTGPTGPTGATGATGPAGRSVTTAAINGSNHLIVTLSDATQLDAGNAVGPQGPQGVAGFTVRSGSGAPAAGLGVNGDFYIDTVADAIYGPKTAGAWGSATSLIGPQGPAGPPGAGSVSTVNGDPGPNVTLTAASVGADPTGTASSAVSTHNTSGTAHTSLFAGKANTAHTHPVGDLTATGTPSSTTYLRGDGAWATPAGGSGTPLGGVLDCSAMTLASQVNAATLSAAPGTKVWLGPHGAGAELGIDEPLILRSWLVVEGMGGRSRQTRLKVTAGFPAGQPVVSAAGYLTNGTSSDNPVVLRGVDIDCAGKVGSHGLVIFNFWSLFEDIQVNNCTGNGTLGATNSTTASILIANRGIDGVTVTSNSHSENVLRLIRINGPAAGASFIVQQSFTSAGNGGAANQDGHLVEAWFSGGGAAGGGRGLEFARTAGWSIRDVHMYGIGDDAARLFACYATDVDGLYIENYGTNDTAADNYNGVQAEFLRGRGSTFSNIKVSSSQVDSPAAGRLTNFHLRAGSGQLNAMVAVTNCESNLNLTAAPTSRKTQAWRLGEAGDTGRSLFVRMAGNQTDPLDGFLAPARFIHSTVTLDEDGTTIPRTVVFSATPTIDPTLEGDRVNITATAAITALTVSTTGARDRQVLQIAVGATGVGPWPVTFAAATRVAGSLTRGPYSVPVGQVLLATLEFSSLATAWVLTDAGVSA